MRVSILTYYFANNYGAVLQATALQKILQEYCGNNVCFLPYCNYKQKNNNALFQHGGINQLIYNIVRFPFMYHRRVRIEKFEQFRRLFLNISKEQVEDDNYIYEAEKYDLIVVGSDQVWNPGCPDFSHIYISVGSLKNVITYGVSIGNATVDQMLKYKNDILNFSCISVREAETVNVLRKIGYSNPISTVLDPVLLFSGNEWEHILNLKKSENRKKYILCYFLRRKNVFKYWKVAKDISKKLGYEIVCINTNAGFFSYTHKTKMDVGPVEFVELIRDASLVLTNSFHGTAFSILFHIPFFSLYVKDGSDNRIKNILCKLGLDKRRISVDDNIDMDAVDIQYDQADKYLDMERKKSLEYIENMVNGLDKSV